MILLIDEFENHNQVAKIDADIIAAIKDGVMSAFRLPQPGSGPAGSPPPVFQVHDGDGWVDVPFGPS